MAENKKLQDVMGVTMDKVKGMIDADSIIGKPINLDDGTIIIPVNRVSYGFASGGSDLPSKQTGNFAGGGGAGITMEPVAFLVIKNDSVRVMQINAHPGTVMTNWSTPSLIWSTRSAVWSRVKRTKLPLFNTEHTKTARIPDCKGPRRLAFYL